MSSKTALSRGNKKASIGALHQMHSAVRVTEVYTCKNYYTLFINKFHFMHPLLCDLKNNSLELRTGSTYYLFP